MNVIIRPSTIKGELKAPSSKSCMQRAVVAAMLCKEGESRIYNPSFCDDSMAALKLVEAFGNEVKISKEHVVIKGRQHFQSGSFSCGESGLLIRMFSSIAALAVNAQITLLAEGGLRRRSLGECTFPPLKVKGPLRGGNISLDGSNSSQFLTGLLMALPLVKDNSKISVNSLKSKPYIDLTIDLIKKFGIEIVNDNYQTFYIRGGQSYRPIDYVVESDWSGVAFLLVAGALGGSITVLMTNVNSLQGDQKIIDVLRKAQAKIEISDNCIKVSKGQLRPFNFDATDCPDLFPPIVVLAAYCNGKSVIRGIGRLKHKESNRAQTLKSEFAKMGVDISLEDDQMIIKSNGGPKVNGEIFISHNDHRVAMAIAVAGLSALNNVQISGVECVNKSYNNFFKDLILVGGQVY